MTSPSGRQKAERPDHNGARQWANSLTRLEALCRRLLLTGSLTMAACATAASTPQPTITAFRVNPEPVLAGTPTTYAWTLTGSREAATCTLDPGDGTPAIPIPECANDATPRHTHDTAGTYTATLDLSTAGLRATAKVTVVNARPTNTKSGTLIWKYQTGFIHQSYIYSSPAIASDGTIIFGSGDRHIYAINPNGTLKWKVATHKTTQGPSEAVPASGMAYAAPSIAGDGTIYVPVMDDGLYALNPDGVLKWRVPIHDVLDHPAAIARDGTIYVAPEHQLDAFHPNGQRAWSFRAPNLTHFTIESTPSIAPDGTIYLCSEHDGSVYALDPDGSLKWRFPHSGDIFGSSPAIGRNDTMYVAGAFDHTLYAINPDGTLDWQLQAGNRFESPPSIGPHGTIYIANDNGVLYAINPDGTLEWHHSIETATDRYKPHLISDTPTIGNNGIIYQGSDNGAIYAFHADGTLAWELHTPKPIESAPAIAPNGILYVTSTSGALYAIHVTATGLANSPWPTLQYDNRRTGRAQ